MPLFITHSFCIASNGQALASICVDITPAVYASMDHDARFSRRLQSFVLPDRSTREGTLHVRAGTTHFVVDAPVDAKNHAGVVQLDGKRVHVKTFLRLQRYNTRPKAPFARCPVKIVIGVKAHSPRSGVGWHLCVK